MASLFLEKWFHLLNLATKMEFLAKYGRFFLKEIPMEELHTKYANHRRLKVYAAKGCQCAEPGCTEVGTRLILSRTKNNERHVDLFTASGMMITVDHIIPKSKGGSNDISNLQPMCYDHNIAKGNKM